MNEIKSFHTQRGNVNVGSILDTLKDKGLHLRDKIASILRVSSVENDLYMLTYILSHISGIRTNPIEKHSRARDEWALKIGDLVHSGVITPNSLEGLLKQIYHSHYTYRWNQTSTFSHYRFETLFEGRKIVIIFYGSSYTHEQKRPFDELLKKNALVRVCWY